MVKKRVRQLNDRFSNPINVGDEVVFIYKDYGYRKISDVSLEKGIVKSLPYEEYRETPEGKPYWYPKTDKITVECMGLTKRVSNYDMIVLNKLS